MTKHQIIAKLRRFGIAHRAKAPKDELERLLADAQRKPRSLPEKIWPGTRKAEDVTPARAGTKRAMILDALHKGCTIDDLMRVTHWNRATVSSAITTDVVKGSGLGVRRDARGVLA